MSETELSVVCKSCGAEVSPYVTECPYCGARLRKRAPELERVGGGLEPKLSRREKRREKRARDRSGRRRAIAGTGEAAVRPWASIALIAIPSAALVVRIALGNSLESFGGVIVPLNEEWWRLITAPFAYLSVGYLFAVGLAVALFGPGLERRFGAVPAFLLLIACGVLGTLAAAAVADQRDLLTAIAGGNGIALGAVGAWFMVARSEARATGERVETAGVVVAAAVILLLPVVVETADFWSGLAGGLVGLLAGFTAVRFSRAGS